MSMKVGNKVDCIELSELPFNGWLDLPSAIAQNEIFLYLSIGDLCSVACVCKRWRELADADVVWKRIASSEGILPLIQAPDFKKKIIDLLRKKQEIKVKASSEIKFDSVVFYLFNNKCLENRSIALKYIPDNGQEACLYAFLSPRVSFLDVSNQIEDKYNFSGEISEGNAQTYYECSNHRMELKGEGRAEYSNLQKGILKGVSRRFCKRKFLGIFGNDEIRIGLIFSKNVDRECFLKIQKILVSQ